MNPPRPAHPHAVFAAVMACLAAPPSLAKEPPHESAIFEAVVRQQLEEHLDAGASERGTVLCVGINPGSAPQAPSREFLNRFGTGKPVRSLSECDPKAGGALEATTGRPAVIVTAGPIDWKAADEAWVTVAYFRTKRQSAVRTYRVVLEGGRWLCLGPILLDLPAGPYDRR